MSTSDKYEVVIGLEVHAQLLTESKAYNSDPNKFGENPNENVGLITLALPGALPKANRKVVDFAIRMGLACGCDITRYNYYDRKNYFYPDLPKGYQITQDKTPICRGGAVDIELKDGTKKTINITRIHMEEDAGKSLHLPGAPESLIDLNRAGTPLIEIVSEPEMRSAQEAYAYLVEVHRLVRYLDICDGNMEEGSFRCDANISVRPWGQAEFGKKVEVKNMNSFRNVARAIEKETERQVALLEAGKEVDSETRMFDGGTGETYSLRSKETLNDYRYFPEPDLQPVVVDDAHLARIRAELPALPKELFLLFTQEYGLSAYDARVIIDERETADYFLAATKLTQNYKAASNWITGPFKALQNSTAQTLRQLNISPEHLAKLISLIDTGKLSFSVASQRLLPLLVETGADPLQTAIQHNLIMDQDAAGLTPIIREIMDRYPDKVIEYKAGKKGLLGLFVGEVMKATKGKANPKDANRLVTEALEA